MEIIKRLINAWVTVKRFEAMCLCYKKSFKRKETFKVRITKKDMDIILFCAQAGIKDVNQLSQLTGFRQVLESFASPSKDATKRH